MTNGILLTRRNQEIAQWSPDPFPRERVGSGHETRAQPHPNLDLVPRPSAPRPVEKFLMGRGAEGLGTRLAAPFAVQEYKQMASAVPSPMYKVILAGKRGVGKSTLYDYLVRNMEPGGGTNTSYSLPESNAGQWDKWLFNVPGPRRAKKIKVLNRTGVVVQVAPPQNAPRDILP